MSGVHSKKHFYPKSFFGVRFTEKNAVEMLDLFLECMPEYNIDRPDGDGKQREIHSDADV